jgi:hypothetical protein
MRQDCFETARILAEERCNDALDAYVLTQETYNHLSHRQWRRMKERTLWRAKWDLYTKNIEQFLVKWRVRKARQRKPPASDDEFELDFICSDGDDAP